MKYLIISTLLISSFALNAEKIYTLTRFVTRIGDCDVYETLFYGDNGTTNTTHDDRYLGYDYMNVCDGGHHPNFVPDFTDPFFTPKNSADIDKWEYLSDGSLKIPPSVKLIPYAEFMAMLEKEREYIKTLKVTKMDISQPADTVKLTPFKND